MTGGDVTGLQLSGTKIYVNYVIPQRCNAASFYAHHYAGTSLHGFGGRLHLTCLVVENGKSEERDSNYPPFGVVPRRNGVGVHGLKCDGAKNDGHSGLECAHAL